MQWHTEPQGTNEAIACLINNIKSEKDFTWTIVSANDEPCMGWDHGCHDETITYIQWMEGADPNAMIRMLTQVVYFFIEKVPLAYDASYEEREQSVSPAWAGRPLPKYAGLGVYQGENRWILMSRVYDWAQAFQRVYPNEMTVYMETDGFV